MKLKMKKILPIMLALSMLFTAGCSKKTTNESSKTDFFPSFEGKDLEGNAVDSNTLFSGNKVTVVNFWFSKCASCVEELGELNALNDHLKKKGGMLIGINTDTLDGNKDQIETAKSIMEEKNASYKNIWFDKNSEAGDFSSQIFAFPTTYVVDSDGKIVGEPLMGSITNSDAMDRLMAQVNQALSKE